MRGVTRRLARRVGQPAARPTLILSASADGGHVRVLPRFTSQGGLTEVADLAWSPESRRLAVVPYSHDGDQGEPPDAGRGYRSEAVRRSSPCNQTTSPPS